MLSDELIGEVLDAIRPGRPSGGHGRAWELMSAHREFLAARLEVGQGPWPSTLLGNGASRAVWERFAYPSLFNAATSLPLDHKLLPEDEALFDSLNTEIFEVVLRALVLSDRVTKHLNVPAPIISQRYDWIRAALIDAVHSVHPPWELVPLETRERIGKHLLRYRSVYSTSRRSSASCRA